MILQIIRTVAYMLLNFVQLATLVRSAAFVAKKSFA